MVFAGTTISGFTMIPGTYLYNIPNDTEAAWHLTTAKNGMSAKTLQKTLGTSYRVAWTLLQRCRVAMVRADRKPLSGDVEVDETFVGGVEHGAKRGRGAHKCIVAIAAEIKQPKGFGRIRMRHVPDASANSLVPFVREVIEPGSVIVTDGWGSYNELPTHGYIRTKLVLSDSGDPAHITMPGVHRVASLLKALVTGYSSRSHRRRLFTGVFGRIYFSI